MTAPENVYAIILIVAMVMLFVIYIIAVIKSLRISSTSRWFNTSVLTVFFLLCAFLAINAHGMEPADLGQSLLTLSLVAITGFYALSAYRQANASVKMAEEMKEQRVMASRPVIIQKSVYKESGLTDEQIQWIGIERSARSYFSHFEVYNAGNGPAIEVEISLLNKEKVLIANEEMKPISWRESFLRASDPAIKFRPSNIANLEESITYYLVCEYQSILSRETWYQTWLAFEPAKSSKKDEIFIVAGEFEFCEVSEKDRIDAFGSRSNPK